MTRLIFAATPAAVQKEQVAYLFRLTLFGSLAGLAVVLFSTFILRNACPDTLLFVWALPLTLLLLGSLYYAKVWSPSRLLYEEPGTALSQLLGLLALTGIAWAAAVPVLMPELNFAHRLLLVAILGFVVMGGIITTGSIFAVFLIFAMPILLSMVVWLLLQQEHLLVDIAMLLVIFTMFTITAAYLFQGVLIKSFALRFKNLELVGSLRSYRDALENTADSIVIFDRDGAVEYCNPAFCKLSGYTRAMLEGMHWDRLFVGMEGPLSYFNSEDSRMGLPWQGDMKLIGSDHREIDIASSFSPVIGRGGELVQFVSIQRDVGEEERNRKRAQKLQQMESLAVLAGGVAHDFNNLLTTILGSASLIRMEDANTEQLEHVVRIEQASKQAAHLCEQMLAYSGQGRYKVVPRDISSLLFDIRTSLVDMAGDKAQLSIEPGESLPLVNIDESCLGQVIVSAVMNALEAGSGERQNRISITARELSLDATKAAAMRIQDDLPGGDHVLVEICDTGEGMEAHKLHKVFNPFYSTRFCGRGLGLPSALGCVRSMQGSMGITSAPGEGSCVYILLPAYVSEAAAAAEEEPADQVLASGRMQGVLVVDDDEGLLKVATRLLDHMGYQVFQAPGGEAAIALYREYRDEIDIVVLDLSMPLMGGVEVLHELKAIDPGVKVILSSGHPVDITASEYGGLGFSGFLQKPYAPHELGRKIGALLVTSVS